MTTVSARRSCRLRRLRVKSAMSGPRPRTAAPTTASPDLAALRPRLGRAPSGPTTWSPRRRLPTVAPISAWPSAAYAKPSSAAKAIAVRRRVAGKSGAAGNACQARRIGGTQATASTEPSMPHAAARRHAGTAPASGSEHSPSGTGARPGSAATGSMRSSETSHAHVRSRRPRRRSRSSARSSGAGGGSSSSRSGAPQWPQRRAPSSLPAWQRGHRTS